MQGEIVVSRDVVPLVEGLEVLGPVMDVPASLHPALVYLASLSVGSRSTMRGSLDLTARLLSVERCGYETLPWHLVRAPHVRALRSWMLENRSAATGNKVLSAVRSVIKVAWEFGQVDTDAYRRAVAVKGLKAVRPEQATGRALGFGEVMALLQVCMDDERVTGVRDAVILILGVYGGLRGVELARLQVADVELEAGQLRIEGKGNKKRVLPLSDGMQGVIEDWLCVLGDGSTSSPTDGPLLRQVLKSGAVMGCGISVQAVHEIVRKRCVEAKLLKFAPHDMRRTFAGEMLDAGADIAVVQQLMGHSSADTTARYDRRGMRARKKAMGLRHVAYERRY